MPSAPPPPPTRPDVADALRRLGDAQADHDACRQASRSGVTRALLAADHRRWEGLGEAIADLASAITHHCGASHFCDARPDAVLLAIRLAESIDDLMDAPAWAVVEAAARLGAIERR